MNPLNIFFDTKLTFFWGIEDTWTHLYHLFNSHMRFWFYLGIILTGEKYLDIKLKGFIFELLNWKKNIFLEIKLRNFI